MKRLLMLALPILLLSAGCNGLSGIYGDNARLSLEGDTYTYGERLGEPDDTSFNLRYSGFSGVETVWILDSATTGTAGLSYSSTVGKGAFKVVSVDGNGSVGVVIEGSGSGDKELPVPKGGLRIKVVGKDASGSLNMGISPGEGISVRPATTR